MKGLTDVERSILDYVMRWGPGEGPRPGEMSVEESAACDALEGRGLVVAECCPCGCGATFPRPTPEGRRVFELDTIARQGGVA